MNNGEARILEDTIRQARAKVLVSAGELRGQEYDRARCRLQVAAWQLGKLAAALRRVRKEKITDPVVRLEIHDKISGELEEITAELEKVGTEVAPWPVRIFHQARRRCGAWWKRNKAVLLSRRYQWKGGKHERQSRAN